MSAKKPLQQKPLRQFVSSRSSRFCLKVFAVMTFAAMLVARVWGAEPAFTENQVKSLCLLNFAKYVAWPAEVLPTTNTPIVIGVIAESKFEADLEKTVGGRFVDGREIVIHRAKEISDFTKLHILFIGAGEKKRLEEILEPLKTLPLLTVGESDQFLDRGGVINFAKKDGKVRIEIDLDAARRGQLQISSKLLKVADLVRGK